MTYQTPANAKAREADMLHEYRAMINTCVRAGFTASAAYASLLKTLRQEESDWRMQQNGMPANDRPTIEIEKLARVGARAQMITECENYLGGKLAQVN